MKNTWKKPIANLCFSLVALAALPPAGAPAALPPTGAEFTAIASWYGPGFHGQLTASGERYDMNKMTAASRTLPFGTQLQVKNCTNGKTCTVVINDRGPYVAGRSIDLSRAAAQRLGITGLGRIVCRTCGRNKKYCTYIVERHAVIARPESASQVSDLKEACETDTSEAAAGVAKL